MYAVGGLGGAGLVDGHHPARARRRQRRRHREPRARARERRPARRRAHADPRPLRRAGRRRDGRVRHRAAGRPARRRPRTPPAVADAYGFPVRGEPGLERRRDGRSRGRRASSTCSTPAAATSSRCCPTRPRSRPRWRRCPLRVHQDIVVSSQMLVDPGDTVVLLPAATRYEQRDGGTQTTTERRIVFSPEIPGSRVGEARSEWEIFVDLGAARRPVARAPDGLRVGLGHPGRDRPRGAVVRGSRATARHRRPGAVGRGAPLRRPGRPAVRDGGREGSVHARAPAVTEAEQRPAARAPAGASSSTRWCTPRSTR